MTQIQYAEPHRSSNTGHPSRSSTLVFQQQQQPTANQYQPSYQQVPFVSNPQQDIRVIAQENLQRSTRSATSGRQMAEPHPTSYTPTYTTPVPTQNHSNTHPAAPSAVPIAVASDIPNVIIFGETGTGKSSLINMLSGAPIAGVSSGALGQTFSSQAYHVAIEGRQYRLWDTAGLNEDARGTVPADTALENLRSLVLNLHEGVSLLVYCVRGTRFRDILRVNYDMFNGIICQSKVPVVVAVTGLEHESPMESWWVENGQDFQTRGLEFVDHACITTSKGKQMKDGSFMFDEEYEESEANVKDLIKKHVVAVPWRLDSQKWIGEITLRMAEYMKRYNYRTGTERQTLQDDFQVQHSGQGKSGSGSQYASRRSSHNHHHSQHRQDQQQDEYLITWLLSLIRALNPMRLVPATTANNHYSN